MRGSFASLRDPTFRYCVSRKERKDSQRRKEMQERNETHINDLDSTIRMDPRHND